MFAYVVLLLPRAVGVIRSSLLQGPTDYDTLAARVWSSTAEAFYTRAACPAMWLILLGSIPLAIAMIRERGERF